MNWQRYVKEFVLPFIENGSKDLEICAGYPKFQQVKEGDVLIFNQIYSRKVLAIRKYKTLEEMIVAEDLNRILPGATADEIVNGLHELLGRTVRLGIIVFELSTS